MHPCFTEEEMELLEKWVDMDSYGWPVKEGCPKNVRERLEKLINASQTKSKYQEIEKRIAKRFEKK